MLNPEKILKALRLTEKSNRASSELNQYTFQVATESNKHQVAEAVEQQFKVTVTRVNIINMKGKPTTSRRGMPGYKSDFKKAIVTLKEGDKIEMV
jgi:large subunit ribosomal protein L23